MGCRKPSIDSHELSERSILQFIALDGHVQMLRKDFKKNPLNFEIKKTRIKEATSFPGFCKDHDRDLFVDLDAEFSINKAHIYKQCYKSIRAELYRKMLQYNALSSALREIRYSNKKGFREDQGIRGVRLRRCEQRKEINGLIKTIELLFGELKSPGDMTFEKYDLQGAFFALSTVLNLAKPGDEKKEDFLIFIQIIPKKDSSSLIIAHNKSLAAKNMFNELVGNLNGLASFVNSIVYTAREQAVYSPDYIKNLTPPDLEKLALLGNPNGAAEYILPKKWKLIKT